MHNANGPARDIVIDLLKAFKEIADNNWNNAESYLASAVNDQARIGGSRAQRDVIEFAMFDVLSNQGKTREANDFISSRRPNVSVVRL